MLPVRSRLPVYPSTTSVNDRHKRRSLARAASETRAKRPCLPRPFLIIVDHPGQINLLLLPRSYHRSAQRSSPFIKQPTRRQIRIGKEIRRHPSSPLSSVLPPAANSSPRRRGHYGRKLATPDPMFVRSLARMRCVERVCAITRAYSAEKRRRWVR